MPWILNSIRNWSGRWISCIIITSNHILCEMMLLCQSKGRKQWFRIFSMRCQRRDEIFPFSPCRENQPSVHKREKSEEHYLRAKSWCHKQWMYHLAYTRSGVEKIFNEYNKISNIYTLLKAAGIFTPCLQRLHETFLCEQRQNVVKNVLKTFQFFNSWKCYFETRLA